MSFIKQNISEDIFQLNDSQELNVRRSQRILDKKCKPIYTQDIIPLKQTATKESNKDFREQTPDFTYLLGTSSSNTFASPELNVINPAEKDDTNCLVPLLEMPIDLKRYRSENNLMVIDIIDDRNELKPSTESAPDAVAEKLTKKESQLEADELEKITDDIMKTEIRNQKSFDVAQKGKRKPQEAHTSIAVKTKKPARKLATKAELPVMPIDLRKYQSENTAMYIENPEIVDDRNEMKSSKESASAAEELAKKESQLAAAEVEKITNQMMQIDEHNQKNVGAVQKGKRKSQTDISIAVKTKKPARKPAVNVELPKELTCKTLRSSQEQQQSNSNPILPVKKSNIKGRGRPRRDDSKENFTLNTTTPLFEYVPPKVKRYYNSCASVSNFCARFSQQSLLPPVYPSHFENQIFIPNSNAEPTITLDPTPIHPTFTVVQPVHVPTETAPHITISLLTPDNSQVIQLESSNETDTSSPSVPEVTRSPLSLRNFFENDEIKDIFDVDKTIFELTELQVHALAAILNMNGDELFNKLADIVQLSKVSLQKLIDDNQDPKRNND